MRVLREMKIKKEIVENDLRPTSKFDGFPPEVPELISSCWNKMPNSRPPMNSIVTFLQAILEKRFSVTINQELLLRSPTPRTNLPMSSTRMLQPPTKKGAFNISKLKSTCCTEHVYALCITAERIWVGLSSGKMQVLSLTDLRVISSVQCFSKQSRVTSLACVPRDESVWVLSDKGELSVIAIHTLKVIHRAQYPGMFKDVLVATAADCTVWGANPDNNSVFVWRSTGQRELAKTMSDIPGACLLSQGGAIVFIAGINTLLITEAATLEILTVVDLSPKRARCPEAMCFAAGFLWICPAGAASVIEVYTPDGQHFISLKGHSGCVKSICPVFTSGGATRTVVSGGFDGSVLVWKADPSLPRQERIKCNAELSINQASAVESIAMAPHLVGKLNSTPGRPTVQFYCALLSGEVVQVLLDPADDSF